MLSIDLYADFVCPWCFIGSERLDRALGDESAIVAHRPFMLDPSTPRQGIVVADMLRKKYGGDPKRMFATVEAAARSSGIELDLTKQPKMYPTAAAHALAINTPQPEQRALVRDLFRAYFLDAMDIADPEVLGEIAARSGLDRASAERAATAKEPLAAARELANEAVEQGIRGVPFFVLAERLAVSGAQSEDVLRDALRRAKG